MSMTILLLFGMLFFEGATGDKLIRESGVVELPDFLLALGASTLWDISTLSSRHRKPKGTR